MNVPERVEEENKKNKDSLSLPCNPVNRQCLSRKIPTEKENKDERTKKNTGRTQIKLNTPHARYNVKMLLQ